MISKVYTCYDSKSELYLNPFLTRSKGEAIRSFQDIANDLTSQIGKHPADFTLFEIGEYDDTEGEYTMHQSKVNCGNALEFQKPTENVTPIKGA